MTSSQPTDPETLKSLLAEALRDPLGLDSEQPIREWLEALRCAFPLWCWQADAYVKLHRKRTAEQSRTLVGMDTWRRMRDLGRRRTLDEREQLELVEIEERIKVHWLEKGLLLDQLPSSYPAQSMLEAVFRDDGLDPVLNDFSPLEFRILLRRNWLTDHEGSEKTPLSPSDWNPVHGWFQPTWIMVQDAALRALRYDPADPQPLDPYESLGRQLVREVEAWISAPADEVDEREDRLDRLRDSIAFELGVEVAEVKEGERRRRGRHWEGPKRPDLLNALVKQEGEELFHVCWNLFPLTLDERTSQKLEAQGIADPDERQLWAARLAIPVLSKCELLALKAERQERALWKPSLEEPYPTPLRLAVWVVAHRLGLSAATVTRKARGSDAEYFRNYMAKHEGQDPFNRHC